MRKLLVLPLLLAGLVVPASAEPACEAASYVVRTMEGAEVPLPAEPILRFANLSDSHIIDDEASTVITLNAIDPPLELAVGNGAAQRLQEEFTDEVLNAMIRTINACHAAEPMSFMIATGDLTDAMMLNETRRYIDNLDGVSGAPTAYEAHCGYVTHDIFGAARAGLACTPELQQAAAVHTGRLVADSQAATPDPTDPTYQFPASRTPRQVADTYAASIEGLSHWIAPGLPESLRCSHTVAGCANAALAIPHYAVFGNHDASARGTVTFQKPFQAGFATFGRHFQESPREFINEMFFTEPQPGPVGHGFNHVDEARLDDIDDRNDGYYAFDAAGGAVRMIVVNTIYDGVTDELHRHGQTRSDTAGLVAGNEVTNPIATSSGAMSQEQFDWLSGQLDAASAAGKAVLVFGHHPDRSFFEHVLNAAGDVGVSAADFNQLLGAHDNVVAYVAGHTHENIIRPCAPGSCAIGDTPVEIEHGFWRIETASLVDYPQEGRIVEVFDLGEAGYALRLTILRPDQSDPVAQTSRTLSEYEATCQPSAMFGGTLDGGPYDQGRLEQVLTNAQEAAVMQKFCFGEASLALAAGAPTDRDVILLP